MSPGRSNRRGVGLKAPAPFPAVPDAPPKRGDSDGAIIKRYQVFLENAGGQGVGEVADFASLEEVWSWLNMKFKEGQATRLWWLKDRKAERAAAGLMTGSAWLHKAGSPDAFEGYLHHFFGWSSDV